MRFLARQLATAADESLDIFARHAVDLTYAAAGWVGTSGSLFQESTNSWNATANSLHDQVRTYADNVAAAASALERTDNAASDGFARVELQTPSGQPHLNL
jgi:uncharacterized protein YukE